MGRKKSFSPHAKFYEVARDPQALERERVTRAQVRFDEDTIIWGDDDSLPLRIMKAVDDSPTATACIGEYSNFIKGSRFTDEGLMGVQINDQGETLWDLHSQLSDYMGLIDGFSVKHSFTNEGKISQSHTTGVESCRFKKPTDDKSKKITIIKYNPYYGVDSLFDRTMSTEYPVFDLKAVQKQHDAMGNLFPGQIYFYGSERPLYKFYPVPKYWSGKHWIYVDSQIQTFHKQNLDSGFFQSVLLNMIGDPNAPSSNPEFTREVKGTDSTKRNQSTKTVGHEFDERMTSMFSGVGKAGRAMVLWSNNADEAVKVSSFPVNAQFDILSGTFTDAIKGVCIATGVDPILLAIQGSGLANAGDTARAVIENMQSKVIPKQRILENYYNNVLLPNLETKVNQKVKLVNYSPINTPITIDDKFWSVMTADQQKAFVKENVPGIPEVTEVTDTPTTSQSNLSPETLQAQAALKGSVGGVNGILSIQQGVVAKTTTKESAISILTIVYGFTLPEAYSLLGVPANEQGVPVTPLVVPDTTNDESELPEIQINDNLKNMTGRQQQQFLRIIKQFGQGKLTSEQATIMLKSGFGLSEEEIASILSIE